MALSGSSLVVLVIGAALLLTGSVRTSMYFIAPFQEGHTVYQSGPVFSQLTVSDQPDNQTTPAGAQVDAVPTAAVATTPVAPNVVSSSFGEPSAGQGADVPRGDDEAHSRDALIASEGTTVPVAEAMAPLGDKFARMWHVVPATGEFVFYDPLFPEESTLKDVATGRTYLILVTESVNVLVNGQALDFVCEDGNCWNTVVWP